MVIGYGASDRESFASTLGYNFNPACTETVALPADGVDNDCDGQIDEETCGNEIDDDGDGLIDEDCTGEMFSSLLRSPLFGIMPREMTFLYNYVI